MSESLIAILVNAVNQVRRSTIYDFGCEILEILPADLAERERVKACILLRMEELETDGIELEK